MKVLISDNLSQVGVDVLKKAGLEVDVNTGLAPEELKKIIGDYDGLVIRSATRVTADLMEGLEMLDRVMPGINSDSTLLYGPEIKFYAMRIATDKTLRTGVPNLYVAGDGAGVSRGIVGAAATGLVAAEGISKQLA